MKKRWRGPSAGQRLRRASRFALYVLAILVPAAVMLAGYRLVGMIVLAFTLTAVGGPAIWRGARADARRDWHRIDARRRAKVHDAIERGFDEDVGRER